MKPPPFEYFDPIELEEALHLLEEHGDDGVVLAGGQSLMPLLNFRLTQPEVLIDINRLESSSGFELSGIESDQDELRFGALTRQRELELSPLVREGCPLLCEAARYVGNPAVRNRGTFAGSLAHGDPAGEFPLVASVAGAQFVLLSKTGRRTLTPDQFFLGPLATALNGSELLAQIRVPRFGPSTGWGFHELDVTPRTLVAAAALVTLDEDGTCSRARLGLAGVGTAPVRARTAEALLQGQTIGSALIREAAHLAALRDIQPMTDALASADYRAALAEAFLGRALSDALARVQRTH